MSLMLGNETAPRLSLRPRRKIRSVSPIIAELIMRRKALGLSQVEVGRRARRSSDVICGWERGRFDPNLRNLENWCAALGLRLCVVEKPA